MSEAAAGAPRCLIPAAGRGTRLSPISSTIPKALLPVGTRPLLQWCLTEALEAGFRDIVVVHGRQEPLERYLAVEGWREGLHEAVRPAADAASVRGVPQGEVGGVVGAALSVREWFEDARPFALFLPDHVRIAGPPPLTAAHVVEAASADTVLVACHRVGPETRRFYRDVGKAELDALAPAGVRPAVVAVQERGRGVFRAAPEGSWRLAPRIAVTPPWIGMARQVAGEAALAGGEADDVQVHRRLVDAGGLRAVPWSGTLVDAGHPAGWLWAQHLLHEAAARTAEEEEEAGGGRLEIETRTAEGTWRT